MEIASPEPTTVVQPIGNDTAKGSLRSVIEVGNVPPLADKGWIVPGHMLAVEGVTITAVGNAFIVWAAEV